MTRVWDHSEQSGAALLVLLALADNADDNGYCHPGVPYIAHKARLTDRGVQGVLARLETDGEIARDKGGGRGIRSAYRVLTGLTSSEIEATRFDHLQLSRIRVQGGGEAAQERVNATADRDPETVNEETVNLEETVNGETLNPAKRVNVTPEKGERDCIPLRKIRQKNRQRSSAAEAAPRPKPARKPTDQQRYFEAVADACGLDPAWMASTDKANVGKLASKLRADPDIDLDFLAECVTRWPDQFPGRKRSEVTPPSVAQLITWIGRCKAEPSQQGIRPSAAF